MQLGYIYIYIYTYGTFEKFDLNLQDSRGQSYDIAAIMTGSCYTGLKT